MIADRFYRRMSALAFGLGLGGSLLGLLATIDGGTLRLPPGLGPRVLEMPPPGAVVAATVAALVVWVAVIVRWERALVRRLDGAGYRLCRACGYRLEARAGEAACPECGRRERIEEVERRWRAFRPRISGLWRPARGAGCRRAARRSR